MTSKVLKRTGKLVQVLEYMDGPQVVLLDRGGDHLVIAVAIEKEGMKYPFFGADISAEQWEAYRSEHNDLRYLFLLPKGREWYFFDLAESRDGVMSLQRTEKDEVAEKKYLPEQGFFAGHHSEPVLALAEEDEEKLAKQKFNTEGKWRLPEMSEFANRAGDIYVFILAVKKFANGNGHSNELKAITDAFRTKPLKGGSSYVNLYSDLRSAQGRADRYTTGSFYYGSPGYLEVRGRRDVFDDVARSLTSFAQNYDELKTQYSELYGFLQKNSLLKADAEEFDNKAFADYIKKKTDELGGGLDLDDLTTIYSLTGKNALLYCKVLLAHFRRLESYFMFFAEGRIKETIIDDKKRPELFS